MLTDLKYGFAKDPEVYKYFSFLYMMNVKYLMLNFDSVKAFLCRVKVSQHRHRGF